MALFENIKQFLKLSPKGKYGISELSPDEAADYPNGLLDIKQRKLDGVLFRGFLTPEEVSKLVSGFDALQEPEYVKTSVGGVYPIVFQQLAVQTESEPKAVSDAKFHDYFTTSEDFAHRFDSRFGVDFRGKLFGLLEKMAGSREIAIPRGYNDEGNYAFCTFRRLIPEAGQMGYHTGNLFRNAYAKFYEHLDTKVGTYDQLSYFVLLQKPDTGGELTLYDLEWKDGQYKEDNRYVVQPDGGKVDINDLKTMTMNMKPGDMIIFNGAQIWHRVEHVYGKTDRITLGGFIGISHDDQKVFLWS